MMVISENSSYTDVEVRPEDGTALKLFQGADGSQDLVVELSDGMHDFLTKENNATLFDYGHKQALLARYDPQCGLLTTYPRFLSPNRSDIGKPKYDRIRRISIEGARPLLGEKKDNNPPYVDFEQFPSGFLIAPFDGLGLIYPLRFIVEAIATLPNVEEIRLCEDDEATIDGTVFRMPFSIYGHVRKTLNRIHRAALDFANTEKRGYLQFDLINPQLSEAKQKPVILRTNADFSSVLSDAISTKGRRSKARSANQSAAVRVVKSSAKDLLTDHYDELLELNREIELVTLEDVISKFEARLADPSLKENGWQKFLSKNPFILRLAFGLPAIVFKEQMPVGGLDFDNKGGKLADFVIKSGAVGNLAIVEIKTPKAKLLGKTHYRGGIHAPSAGISGAVTQVMDQRFLLQENINMLQRNSRSEDVHTYAVGCIVIIGTTPTSESSKKSFELYRNNLVGVTIITFDELLDKLKALHQFLIDPPHEEESDEDDFRDLFSEGLYEDLEEDEDGDE